MKLQGFLTACLFGNSFFFLSPAFSENDIGETEIREKNTEVKERDETVEEILVSAEKQVKKNTQDVTE